MFTKKVGLFCLCLLVPSLLFAKSYGAKLCQDESEQYQCYTTKKGDTWKKLFPDDVKKDLVMRINRRNLPLYKGLIIAIPNSDSLNLLDYSPFERDISPSGAKLIIVSLHKLAFGAYDSDGTLVHWGPISSGKGYCKDIGRRCGTPTGNFAIYRKGGPGCYSSKFPAGRGGAPMPYCMFFRGGFALHGSYELPGFNASHGCVRLLVPDAKWLNKEFTVDSPRTAVILKP